MAVSLSTLRHLLLHPKKFWHALVRFLHFVRFSLQYAGLRRSTAILPTPSKRVLFVSFSDWEARGKLDGVLGAAMRTGGAMPVVLTLRSCTWLVRYLHAFGIKDILYYDDLLSGVSGVNMKEVDDALSGDFTFASLLSWRKDGADIGRHALSTAVRQLRTGSLSLHDPKVIDLLRSLFHESLRSVEAARRLFASERFDAVLFMEKGYTPYGEIFDAAVNAGIPTVQYHHAQRSDLMIMKRYKDSNRHQHNFSLSKKSWNDVKSMSWSDQQEQKFMDELKSGYENGSWFNRKFLLNDKQLKTVDECRKQLGLDPKKKTAVIFSHVLWDATFFFGDNLFTDYEEWLLETVRVAVKNTNVNWLIKLHPDYVWKVKQLGPSAAARDAIAIQAGIGELPAHIKIVPPEVDISTYSFFAFTDYCITVRGTIGIEAPCFGIPVFTAGTGRYSGLGFTNDSSSREEYLEKMRTIHTFPALSESETSLARRHAHALFQCRTLPFTSCEIAPTKKSGSIAQDAILRVRTLDDVRRAPDLTAFVTWVLESKDEDFLSA